MTAAEPGHWEIQVPMTVPCGVRQHRPLSNNDHWHWRKKAKHTAQIREAVAWTAKSLGIPPQQHITVSLHYAPGDHRRRDASNLMATMKPAVDGLVDAGVVPDDTARWVTELMPIIRHPGPTNFDRSLVLVVRAGCHITIQGGDMIATRTRTHVYVEFANPYLACVQCSGWVTGWHDDERCGCDDGWWNEPCGHRAATYSACPSWGPVDGCSCQEHLGRVDHGQPVTTQEAG